MKMEGDWYTYVFCFCELGFSDVANMSGVINVYTSKLCGICTTKYQHNSKIDICNSCISEGWCVLCG